MLGTGHHPGVASLSVRPTVRIVNTPRTIFDRGTEGDLYTWEDFHEGEYAACDTQAELLGVIAEFFESLAIDAAMQEDD